MKKNVLIAAVLSLFVLSVSAADIKFPAPAKKGGMPLNEALSKRQTIRKYHENALSAACMANLLWAAYLNYGGEYREARDVSAQIDSCRRKITSINSRLKRNQKASRDMARVVEITAGESDVLGKLATFSKLLPDNVLVSSMRWSDSGVDFQLQSENANINLPELLKPLSFWKIGNLQQRQMWGSDVTSINLRLVPNVDDGKEKDKKKGGSSNSRRRQFNSGRRSGR
jgi:hypothetical protein